MDLILAQVEVVEDVDIFFGILIVGFIFFGYVSKARIFYLAAASLLFFIAVSYVERLLIFIPLLGVAMTLVVFTFLGSYTDE